MLGLGGEFGFAQDDTATEVHKAALRFYRNILAGNPVMGSTPGVGLNRC